MLVFRKDWQEIRQSKQMLIPIIILPVVMVVVLPLVAVQVPVVLISGQGAGNPTTTFSLPFEISSLTAGMTAKQAFVYSMSTIFFAPFTLLVPLIVSSIISADSFAGEKERKTVEALLATPLTDMELLFGKILASFVPAILVTFLSFAVYAAITDYVDYPMFGYAILPNFLWILILIGLAPAFAIAATGLTVIVSTRVSGTREAQQLTGLLVIPIIILLFGQTTGIVLLGVDSLLVLLVIMAVADYLILRIGVRLFNRERIVSKL
jgi:ABC-2 type transport system permease protein